MSETSVDHIRVYQDHAGQYRWAAVARNNEIVAQGESHTRLSDAVRAATGALGTTVPVVVDDTSSDTKP